jgi:hypothetical protein
MDARCTGSGVGSAASRRSVSSVPRETLLPGPTPCRRRFQLRTMGVGSTLSQRPIVCCAKAVFGRDWVYLGLARLFFGKKTLRHYQNSNGVREYCCVPIAYKEGDLKLGWWVATQRRSRQGQLRHPSVCLWLDPNHPINPSR